MDVPGQMALREPGNAQAAPHAGRVVRTGRAMRHRNTLRRKSGNGAELPASSRTEGSESNRQRTEALFDSCQAAKWERSLPCFGGKGP